jgi:hypothetical protein
MYWEGGSTDALGGQQADALAGIDETLLVFEVHEGLELAATEAALSLVEEARVLGNELWRRHARDERQVKSLAANRHTDRQKHRHSHT